MQSLDLLTECEKKQRWVEPHRGLLQTVQQVVVLVLERRPVLHTQRRAVAVMILDTHKHTQTLPWSDLRSGATFRSPCKAAGGGSQWGNVFALGRN